jgi:hypothetical protein
MLKDFPPNGTWCWVTLKGGVEAFPAKRDSTRAGGWSNDDTWEDFDNEVADFEIMYRPGAVTADRLIQIDSLGKYLMVFEEPLDDATLARMQDGVNRWMINGQPVAVISGGKFRIVERPETVKADAT